MNRLQVDHVSKTFADGTRALDDVGFALKPGEFFSIVGPTNAGKSTLLKIIAGLHLPDQGRIVLDGEDVTALEPSKRQLSLLFQNIALFPTRTGFDNIAYPLRLAKFAEAEVKARVQEVAALVNVTHLLDRLPKTFSGGEQQRVAIARSLAHRSRLLMLDEPLTNLDARLRITLRREFKALHRQTGQTIVYVTHDQVEALSLSDRMLVLNNGRVEQIGTPDEIYHRPLTRFVAEFIGTPPMNIIDHDAGLGLSLPVDAPAVLPARYAIGIRPEDVVASLGKCEATPLPGEIVWIERLGSRNVLDVRLGGQSLRAVVRPDHEIQQVGAAWFGIHADGVCLLDRDSGRFIRSEN